MKILVVEDDQDVRDSLRRLLHFHGYEVIEALDGKEALEVVRAQRPDLIILDVMLPKLDGMDVCRILREEGDATPVLMLTARSEVSYRVLGLDAGADDYLPKPFATAELLARLRSLQRRLQDAGDQGALHASTLRFQDLSLNTETREVRRGDRQIGLTRTEFSLLELLMRNARKVLARQQILAEVWGYDFPASGNALEVYIGYLRKKTEAGGEPRLIQTVRGIGYVLRENAE
ncbi:response regulator transcription factor [Corynebacterium aquatimens]|uniref:response regulator transcription factor n=1 Tax=Corynebacterium aquatimens TaxID=1190508 RepID=UPI00253F8EE5|nr:response regulator transcription factor [Corynebacterium aquatimens]QYH20058.1 response regulator transcription factor [Corynebacterium aquatimens]